MKKHEPSLADRLGGAAQAKRAQIEKARAKTPENDPKYAEKQAARRAIAVAREARKAEVQAAEEAVRALALIAEQEAREAAAIEEADREVALAAEAKAARDARYAARRARKKR
ncbi:MAG: hypothetical protein H8E30_16875 [Alphaproteobacteria bacterium]|nr:hypothetical protein [Alphaproteobacteria bacterium]